MTLKKYNKKRDVSKTNEPEGKEESSGKNIFVVQKHDASRHHYDFRLEINGVLKSWAVPRGPSVNTKERRLAVMTEDHPMSYADFEGIIPEDQYGGGKVIVWDNGTFENLKDKSLGKAFDDGKLEIELEGKKLKGKRPVENQEELVAHQDER